MLFKGRSAVLCSAVCLLLVTLATTAAPASAAPRPTVGEVRKQVDALRRQAEQITENYDATRERISALGVRLAAAQSQLTAQRQSVDLARKRLGQIAAEVYKAGDLATASLFLEDQPDRYVAANGLLSSLADQRADAVQDLVDQRRLLLQRTTDLQAQQQTLQQTQRELLTQQQALEAKLNQAAALLGQLSPSERRQLQDQTAADERAGLLQAGVKVPTSGRARCSDVPMGPLDARVAKVIAFACAQLGRPYQWGADGPTRFDCSGLVMRAWAQAGVSLPHNAALQSGYGTPTKMDNLRPGDVLFFYSPIGHNGIYLGSGLMLHAPRGGETVQIIPVRYVGMPVSAVRL